MSKTTDSKDKMDSAGPAQHATGAPGAQLLSMLGARQAQAVEPLEDIPVEALSAVQDSAADEVARIREQAGPAVKQESLI